MAVTSKVSASQVDGVSNFRPIQGTCLYRSSTMRDISSRGVDALNRLGIKTLIDMRDVPGLKLVPIKNLDSTYKSRKITVHSDPTHYDYAVSGRHEHLQLSFFGWWHFRAVLSKCSWFLFFKYIFLILLDMVRRTQYSALAMAVDNIRIYGLLGLHIGLLDCFHPPIRTVLKIVADSASSGCCVGCVFGKDRTGIISALIQEVCGIDRHTIAVDFAKSQDNIVDHRHTLQRLEKTLKYHPQVSGSPAHTMLCLLDYIDARYGSVEKYLTQIGFGLEWQKKLRKAASKTKGN